MDSENCKKQYQSPDLEISGLKIKHLHHIYLKLYSFISKAEIVPVGMLCFKTKRT